jgi:pimeloyl-ACP methyl ester carboxylesterase
MSTITTKDGTEIYCSRFSKPDTAPPRRPKNLFQRKDDLMNTVTKSISAAMTVLVLAAMILSPAAVSAKEGAMAKPTIVLVHGAFAESSSWDAVISRLLAQGYPVVAVANPLRGVKYDADYVASVLKGIQGPIVLVGHSYGGSVISNAVNGNGNVKALVYVAGFAPEAGESASQLSARFPGATLAPTLAAPVELPDGGKDLYIQQAKLPAQFAPDVPPAQARVMAVTQRPVTEAALNEGAGAPAWKTVPSWFIYGELDKNIPAAVHAFMAQRAGARETVEIKGGSHVVMISHPDAVVKIIGHAAAAK